MRLVIIAILLFAFYSCQESRNQNVQTVSNNRENHLINAFGKVGFDTSTFNRLKCGLYINNFGVIAYKATDNSLKFDSTQPLDIYLTTVYNQDSGSSDNDVKEMRSVVDTISFVILSNGDFEDKNYHYRFTPMSDGGTIVILKKTKP